MHNKLGAVILTLWASLFLLASTTVYADSVEEWQKLIQDGSHNKFDGQYKIALQLYAQALKIAENQKLPPKYLPISLCRLADVEVITNKIDEADTHFQQIVDLLKQQKQEGILDPQVSFWAAVLSDSYLSNTKPETREKCIKRSCYLKAIIYGDAHNECIGCLNKLADFYIDQGKVDKAIHILTHVQGIVDKRYGKNPDGLGETLHKLAIKCRTEHKYETAKQLELEVIKLAQSSKGNLKAGLPAFYCFLGMNEFAQDKIPFGKQDFVFARRECTKIKTVREKISASRYFEALIQPIVLDQDQQRYFLAENELRQLISIEQCILNTSPAMYQLYSRLAALLDVEHLLPEGLVYLNRCIAIAEAIKSPFQIELPDLYLRLAMTQLKLGKIKESDETFRKALGLEKEKMNFRSAVIWLYWGFRLSQKRLFVQANEKLNTALIIARKLSPEKRGTVIIDADKLKISVCESLGKKEAADSALKEFTEEIKIQRQFKQFLGPNLYFQHNI